MALRKQCLYTIARWERGEIQLESPAMLRLALKQLEFQRLAINPSRAVRSRLTRLEKLKIELEALTEAHKSA